MTLLGARHCCGLGVTLCHLGCGAPALPSSLQALLRSYSLVESRHSHAGEWSASGIAEQLARHCKPSFPEVVVLYSSCQESSDQRRIEQVAARVKQLPIAGLIAIVSLPPASDPPLQNDRLRCCDGVIGLPARDVRARNLHEVGLQATCALLDGLFIPGFINYDLIDLLEVMQSGAVFAHGLGHGPLSASQEVTEEALRELQQQGVTLARVKNVLVEIEGGPGLSLNEIDVLATRLESRFHPIATIALCTIVRDDLERQLKVSLLASS